MGEAKYLDENIKNKYEQSSYLQGNDIVVNSTGGGTLGRIGYISVELIKKSLPIVPDSIDFEKVAEFIEKIKKYDSLLEDEYAEHSVEVREKLDEISLLVQKKENPSRIKSLLMDLKNLSVGIAGSLIATGIVEGVKVLLQG